MNISLLEAEEVIDTAGLEKHDLDIDSVNTLVDDFTDFIVTKNTGKAKSSTYGTDNLHRDEMPDTEGREGETQVRMSFDDIQYFFRDQLAEDAYGLPQENTEEAFGALFGASYALQRQQIAENGFSEDSPVQMEKDIEDDEQFQRFMEAGGYEIRMNLIGDSGLDYELLEEQMSYEQAMETYDEVLTEMTGEGMSETSMDF